MNELSVQELESRLNSARVEELAILAWQGAQKTLEIMSVSGVKQGLNNSTDVAGQPFKPLKGNRPSGGSKPLQDKGLLGASISASVRQGELTLSANAPGARLHQMGGTIIPKAAKWLTIPKTAEAQRIGSPGKGRFPRKLFFIASKTATDRAFLTDGKTVQYVLVKRVVIPQRWFLGWSAETLDKCGQALAEEYGKQLAALFTAGKIK